MLTNPSSIDERKAELQKKADLCREFLNKTGTAGLLLSEAANVSWLTGGSETHVVLALPFSAGPLLVTAEDVYLCSDNIEAPRMFDEEIGGLGIKKNDAPWYDTAAQRMAIEQIVGKGVVMLDTDVEAKGFLAGAQMVMTPEEQARYRILGAETAKCLEETCRVLEPGWSEYRIAGELAQRCYAAGIFPTLTLVAADERVEKYRHPLATGKCMERYAMVVLCARRWGLITNQTRIVHFGAIPEELQKKHEAVMRVDTTFICASTPGAVYGDVFKKAQAVYAEMGFADEWQLHHQGGTTGYQGRYFKATAQTTAQVEAGHVVAWNPSITGTKSEDTVLVKEDGHEVFTVTPEWPRKMIETPFGSLERCEILER